MLLRVLLAVLVSFQLTEGFDEMVSRKLLNLAAGAYGTSANQYRCASKSLGSNVTMVGQFSISCGLLSSTCSGYIVSSGNTLYVVFAGSKDNAQLIEQFLKIGLNRDFHEKGLVNKYVADAHDLLWPSIEPILQNSSYANCSVVFTGHSLGASLSVLTAARSVIKGMVSSTRITVWTFGEPRLESYGFTNWFNTYVVASNNSIRVVHRDDYIAQQPPCVQLSATQCSTLTGLLPYHRGTEYWYNNDMNLMDEYTATCSDANLAPCPFNITAYRNPSGPINDHSGYYLYNVPIYGRGGCL